MNKINFIKSRLYQYYPKGLHDYDLTYNESAEFAFREKTIYNNHKLELNNWVEFKNVLVSELGPNYLYGDFSMVQQTHSCFTLDISSMCPDMFLSSNENTLVCISLLLNFYTHFSLFKKPINNSATTYDPKINKRLSNIIDSSLINNFPKHQFISYGDCKIICEDLTVDSCLLGQTRIFDLLFLPMF